MNTSNYNDREFFQSIETEIPYLTYIGDYMQHRLNAKNKRGFIVMAAQELLVFICIEAYYREALSQLNTKDKTVIDSLQKRTMRIFKRKINFSILYVTIRKLSTILLAINSKYSIKIPFPIIKRKLVNLSQVEINEIIKGYVSQVRAILQGHFQLLDEEVEFLNDDMLFLTIVKQGEYSQYFYMTEITRRIRERRMSQFLILFKEKVKHETLYGFLSQLKKLYNTIADAIVEAFPLNASLREACEKVQVNGNKNFTYKQLSQIDYIINVLKFIESEMPEIYTENISFLDDEDLMFIEDVERNELSQIRISAEINRRIKEHRMYFLLDDIRYQLRLETDKNVLRTLYELCNTIINRISHSYPNNYNLSKCCHPIPFNENVKITDDQYDQIGEISLALGCIEMEVIYRETGYSYPGGPIISPYRRDNSKDFTNGNNKPMVFSKDLPNGFTYPKQCKNIRRANALFNLAAQEGIISNDWMHYDEEKIQQNIIVYFCQRVFCEDRDCMTYIPSQWIEKNFHINNPSRIKSDYTNNGIGKPRGAEIIDALIEKYTV